MKHRDFAKIIEKGVKNCDKQSQPLHLLELFGGIGAPRRALEKTIGRLVQDENPDADKRSIRKKVQECIKSIDYVEYLPYAVQAYNHIFDLSNHPQDIRLWNLSVDILVHGSPCQDFSKEGNNNLNSGRSILYERSIQVLDPHPEDGPPELTRQPKLVIWENVPQMVHKYPDILQHYLTSMESFGYTNTFCASKKYVKKGGYISPRSIMLDHMLDASEYGIPQARERFFCISVLNEYADKHGAFRFPDAIDPNLRPTLDSYLDKKADVNAYAFTPKELEITKKVNGQWYVKQAVKGDFGAGNGWVPVNEGQRVDLAFPNSTSRRGRIGDYASTFTTSPRQGVLLNDKFRLFTAKEKLMLMGYTEDDYNNMVDAGLTENQITFLSGNSICVPVLEQIFLSAFAQYPELTEKTLYKI